MLYLSTPLELLQVKTGSEGRMEFSAYASTFNNVDHGGDVIEKGAFRESLKTRSFRPLLWQHNMNEPIGIEKSLREDSKGLLGTWELVDTMRGMEAYKLLKAGAVRAMSIGYIPTKWEYQQGETEASRDTTRVLKSVDLLENSVVSLPMNDQAQVQNVKQLVEEAVRAALARKDEPGHTEEQPTDDAVSYEEMTLAQLADVVSEVVSAFGERTKDLLSKLAAGDYPLTEAKRTDLQALLETFSAIDAVRSDAEAVLTHQPKSEPTGSVSALSLAIAMRRHRMRAREMRV